MNKKQKKHRYKDKKKAYAQRHRHYANGYITKYNGKSTTGYISLHILQKINDWLVK